MSKWTEEYIEHQIEALRAMDLRGVNELIALCMNALKHKNKIFVIGNGGSAANASHFTEDLGKSANDAIHENALHTHARILSGFNPGRFRILSLCDSVPYITAIGNDYCFDDIFVRQLQTLADPGDLLIGTSVSGTSPNLVRAFKWANRNNLRTVAITGQQGRTPDDSIFTLADTAMYIRSMEYGIVEDVTMTIFHMIVNYIMDKME